MGSSADRSGRRRSAAFLTWMSDAATYYEYCKPSVEQDMQIEAHNATTRLVPQIAFPHQWNKSLESFGYSHFMKFSSEGC